MSSRYGMADGRCFTVSDSSNILYNIIAKSAGKSPMDSSNIRQFLQSEQGGKVIKTLLDPSGCLKTTNLSI